MKKCLCCNDRDLSQIPYGICFECGNHGSKYIGSWIKPDYFAEEEHQEAIKRFRTNFCQWFRDHDIKKCNCSI